MGICRVAFPALSVAMFCLFVFSFGDETLCASGCGNLMAPVFRLSYSAFGSWGVRVLLLMAALLFLWATAHVRD